MARRTARRPRERAGAQWTSPSAIGSLTHQAIQYLAVERAALPTPATIQRTVARLVPRDLASVYRGHTVQWVSTLTATYFRKFDPRPEWDAVGVELVADAAVAIDLVWQTPSGVVFDEIKTGVLPSSLRGHRLELQVAAQQRAGLEAFGSAFQGVRVAALRSPALEHWFGSPPQALESSCDQ